MTIALRSTDLTVEFPSPSGPLTVLHGVNLEIRKGEILGVVGKSGAGKSILVRALIDLVPSPGQIVNGQIEMLGRDLLSLTEAESRSMRGNEVGVVVQNPRSHLHPLLRVGQQIMNVYRTHRNVSKREARERAIEALREVGIPAPVERMAAYPHELSGGMAQRVLIAMALVCEPQLLLADEPTSGLDVTIQDQILTLLRQSVSERGVAGLLVSRDMGIIANFCDRVAVMHEGRLVESAEVSAFFDQAQHEVSRALIASASYSGSAESSQTRRTTEAST